MAESGRPHHGCGDRADRHASGWLLLPLLQEDDRVARVIGIARRAVRSGRARLTKMEYRHGDVRDAEALRAAFDGADVVVHLAFLIFSGGKETTQAINVEGTLNAFRAAAEAGARRSSMRRRSRPTASIATTRSASPRTGRPVPRTGSSTPRRRRSSSNCCRTRPSASGDRPVSPQPPIVWVRTRSARRPSCRLGLLRVQLLRSGRRRSGLPSLRLVPDLPMQLIHQDDVAEALRLCVVGAGLPAPTTSPPTTW